MPPLGARQPGLPAVTSPLVFKPRFLFSASVHSLLLPLPFLASLVVAGFTPPSLATGLCKVPSDNFAALAFASSASASFLASSSKRRCASSCFLRLSSACMAANVECLLASCSRKAISSAPNKSLRLIVFTTTGSADSVISTSTGSTIASGSTGASIISLTIGDSACSSTSGKSTKASTSTAVACTSSAANASVGCSMTRFLRTST